MKFELITKNKEILYNIEYGYKFWAISFVALTITFAIAVFIQTLLTTLLFIFLGILNLFFFIDYRNWCMRYFINKQFKKK